LLFLFAVALTARAWWYGMRTLWSGVRRSAFFAGMVTAGSTLATVVTLVLGMAVAQAASALSAQETARALETCSGSAGDCTQKLLQSAVGPKPRQLAPAPGGNGFAPPPEPPPGFDECVEELYRPDANGKIARAEAVGLAFRYTNDFAAAEDIVEDTIIDVCFQGDRIVNVRPYFIQSVKYAAARETRRRGRLCPLEPNEPPPFPEPCFQEGPIVDLIRLERRMKAIEDAICELDADQRKVIVLHVRDGLSHAEIARRLRISEAAARQRYSRAVQALRSKFDQRCQ
jgi:RNA polymerase sigma-70 factor (ECF subfamily)